MGGQLNQLRLLLWKNFLLKRRQPLVVFLEIPFPLILAVILVIIRSQNVGEQKGTFRNWPRAQPSAGHVPFVQSILCREIAGEQFEVDMDKNGFPNLTFTPATVMTNLLQSLSGFNDAQWQRLYEIPYNMEQLAAQLNNSQFYHFLERNFTSVADAITFLSGPLVTSPLNSSAFESVLRTLPIRSSDVTALSSASIDWLKLYQDVIVNRASSSSTRRSRRATNEPPTQTLSSSGCSSLSSVSPQAVQVCKLAALSTASLLPASGINADTLTPALRQLLSSGTIPADQVQSLLRTSNISVTALRPVFCDPTEFASVFTFPATVPQANQTRLQQNLCNMSDAQISELISALVNASTGQLLVNGSLTAENAKILSLLINLSEDMSFINAVLARIGQDGIDLRPLTIFYGYMLNTPPAHASTRSGRQLLVQQLGAFFCGDNIPLIAGPPDNSIALRLLLYYMITPRRAAQPEPNADSADSSSSGGEAKDESSPSGGGSATASDLQIQNEIFNELIARAANGNLRVLFAPDNSLTRQIISKMLQPLQDFKDFMTVFNASYWRVAEPWGSALQALNSSLASPPAVQFLVDYCPTVETFYNLSNIFAGRQGIEWNSSLELSAAQSIARLSKAIQDNAGGKLVNVSQSSAVTVAKLSQWRAYTAQVCDNMRLLRYLFGQDTLLPPQLAIVVYGIPLVSGFRIPANQTLFDDLEQLNALTTYVVDSSLDVRTDNWLQGTRDEAELETIAANAWDFNITTLAGLVFTNLYMANASTASSSIAGGGATGAGSRATTPLLSPNTTSLPPHVIYKLRQNASMVTSTRWIHSIYWTPGPCKILFCRRYEIFGFLPLQDLVDKAIIDLQLASSGYSTDATSSTYEGSTPLPTTPGYDSTFNSSTGYAGTLGSWLQNFPYPCFLFDEFTTMSVVILPMAIFLSFLFSIAMLVKNIVYEKEQRLKEVMKVMGLSNTIHLVAWFITSIISILPPVTLLAIVLKYGKVMMYSDITIIWVYLFLFGVSCIGFSFLVSVFFSRANLAASCGGVFFFMAFFPYMALFIRQDSVTYASKAISCLLSPSAFSFATQYVTYYEQQQKGLQWDNLAYSPLTDDPFNFQQCMIYLVIDCLLYFALAWYLDHVLPGRYGIPRPWYFPFQASHWMGDEWVARRKMRQSSTGHSNGGTRRRTEGEENDVGSRLLHSPSDEDVSGSSPSPCHAPANGHSPLSDDADCPTDTEEGGVVIKNMTKRYPGAERNAVDGLSVAFHPGQITSFLGHNGAGKTTTMSVLIGLHQPTTGTIYVQGMDIRTDIDRIRRSLGFCPQHNVLFDRLTVEEHLVFYAQIKRVSRQVINENLTMWLTEVGLLDKRHCLAKTLSGGMKRKLSVAIAFVGGSQTVVLDEPTAGIDPYARRSIWDLLVQYRNKGRTIILSTHHMDEADILGDRVAIIAQGRLRCVGSSMHLKSRYGHGYTLTLVKKSSTTTVASHFTGNLTPGPCVTENGPVSFDEHRLTAAVCCHVSGSTMLSNGMSEVVYQLPSDGARDGSFQRLFNFLDDNLPMLAIESYGLTDTSLEEVFMTLLSGEDEEETAKPGRRRRFCAACKRLLRFCPCIHRVDSCSGGTEPSDSEPPAENGTGTAAAAFSVNSANADAGNEMSSPLDAESGDGFASSPINHGSVGRSLSPPLSAVHRSRMLSGYLLALHQFRALFIKRLHHARRNWKAFLAQVVVPASLVAMALLNVLALTTPGDDPAMTLLPSTFSGEKFTPTRTYDIGSTLAVRRATSMDHPCGIGTEHFWQDGDGGKSKLSFCYNYTASSVPDLLPTPNKSPSSAPPPYRAANYSFLTNADRFQSSYYRDPVLFSPYTYAAGFNISNPNSCTDNCSLQPDLCESVPQTIGQASVLGGSILQNLDQQQVDMDNWLLRTTSHFVLKRWGAVSVGSESLTVVNSTTQYPFVNALARRPANRAWNNLNGYHAAPIYMNVLSNALLRGTLNNTLDPVQHGISTINHPFAKTAIQLEKEYTQSGIELINAIFIILALSFVPASFILYLIAERASGGKHLQRMAGVSGLTYWTSTFCWDMVNYLVTVVTLLIVFAIFGKGIYTSAENFPAVVGLLLLYGWSITPLMYPFSFYFEVPSTAYVILLCGNVAVGAFGTIATFFLQFFPDNAALTAANVHLRTGLLIFPNFCLGRGLMDLSYLHYGRLLGKELGASWYVVKPSVGFDIDQVGRNLVSMAVSGVFFFALTLAIEYGFFTWIWVKVKRVGKCMVCSMEPVRAYVRLPTNNQTSRSSRLASTDTQDSSQDGSDDITGDGGDVTEDGSDVIDVDADVEFETERVQSEQTDGDMLVLKNLTKVYKKHVAVNELSLGVRPGTCFGLLGVNGAGKTSTFKMLTGEERITSGDALVNSLSVLRDKADVRRLMGYCPQFDALDDLLTAREHLTLYARLRGVRDTDTDKAVRQTIQDLQLSVYADRVSGGFSGGNKRKLSTAISLIGRPPVILLDEPTTGMDVKARRFLLSVIDRLAQAGHCIIFTSHSMEECEALCHRLAIMVNGKFQCIGSPQHLKSKFGSGYTLSIRLHSSQAMSGGHDEVKAFCQRAFSGAVLEDEHHSLLVYHLPVRHQSLAVVFDLLESVRQQYQIEDFSLSQTSLDQVFIGFAKHQVEDEADSTPASNRHNRGRGAQDTHSHDSAGADGGQLSTSAQANEGAVLSRVAYVAGAESVAMELDEVDL